MERADCPRFELVEVEVEEGTLPVVVAPIVTKMCLFCG